MRETNRLLTCDRCGSETTVPSFSWSGLHAATDAGWSKYACSTARQNIHVNYYKDLCPACTTTIASMMRGHEWVLKVLNSPIASIRHEAELLDDKDLTALRDWMTRELKRRR